MPKVQCTITWSRLKEVLDYDPESGEFRWRVRAGTRGKVGSLAGTVKKSGYVQIRFGGVQYLGHRLAWFYVTGRWPTEEIDHRDCNPSNNRFANLRPATRKQNGSNRKRNRNNTSGFKGVSWRNKERRWRAQIRLPGTIKTIELGLFQGKKDAALAYDRAAVFYHGEFARLNFPN